MSGADTALALPVNDPATVAEVRAVVEAYEAALISGDLAALDAFFLDRDDTIRYGPGESLYGARAIAQFRAARPSAPRPLTVERILINSFGHAFAVANTEFRLDGDTKLGRQTQTWVCLDGRWQITSAHVSYIDDGQGRRS